MSTGRLEALSDGVLAIAIALRVLEIKVPILAMHPATTLSSPPMQRWPLLVSTVLSFIAIGCDWVNHHAPLRALRGADRSFFLTLLWLLALCLIPFATALLGETMRHGDSIEVAAPLCLRGLALTSLCWALLWWHARQAGLIREEISAVQHNRLSRIFNGSVAMHCDGVISSLRWPRAIGFKTEARKGAGTRLVTGHPWWPIAVRDTQRRSAWPARRPM